MSGVFSTTIPGKAPLARFPVRACASALIIASLSLFHAAPATAQHRFNVPQSAHGMQNAKQAAQIRLLEKWAGLVKKTITVTEDGKVGIETPFPMSNLHLKGNIRIDNPGGTNWVNMNWHPTENRFTIAPNAGSLTIHGLSLSWARIPPRSDGNDPSVLLTPRENGRHLELSSSTTKSIYFSPGMNSIFATGNVGIGTETPTTKLDVTGNGQFSGSLTATAFYQSSDRNLKKNITAVSNPFALLHGVYGKRYMWKDSDKSAYGVIAQDIELVMPEAIHTAANGVKSVDYSQLIAPMIEAVKQLESRVRYLESVNSNTACNDGYEEKNGVMSTRGSR